MEIEYKGYSYIIEKLPNEVDDIFYKRMWIVVKQEPKTQQELDKAIHMSILWSNITYLKCTYSDEIMSNIQTIFSQDLIDS